MAKFSVWSANADWLGNVEADDQKEALEVAKNRYPEADSVKLVSLVSSSDRMN